MLAFQEIRLDMAISFFLMHENYISQKICNTQKTFK